MRSKGLILVLLMLAAVACSVDPVVSEGIPTSTIPSMAAVNASATASPTALPTASLTSTATPTLLPTSTRTLTPRPTRTPGPEALYQRLILVDQDRQMMYVYEDGAEVRRIPVSTGKPDQKSTITPAWEGEVGRYVGTFFAFGMWADDAWYLFEHYGSMLIHGAPYLKQGKRKIYQELDALGDRPVSHGCIRLPPEEAKWLTAWQPQGAHVMILPLTRAP